MNEPALFGSCNFVGETCVEGYLDCVIKRFTANKFLVVRVFCLVETLSLSGNPAALADISPALRTTPANGSSGSQSLPASNQIKSSKKRFVPEDAPTGASAAAIEAKPLERNGQPGAAGPTAALSGVLSDENIPLERTALKALVSVNDYLNPFGLDASSSEAIYLRDVLRTGLERNLDLAISQSNSKAKQWDYFSALGGFLPDATMAFQDNFLKGAIGVPFNLGLGTGGGATGLGRGNVIHINSPFILMGPGFRFNGYQGGKVLFGVLKAKHEYKAARAGEKASLSDTLMTITKDYYNLVLSEALLQIRIQAVRTSEEQLRNNTNRFHSGLATNLDVLQSTTQLSRDRQSLVDQQIARRNASIKLAEDINVYLGKDLLPVEMTIKKVRLLDPQLSVSDLLRLAIDHRPELKQFDELRLAAKRAIIVSQAPLHPTFAFTGNIFGVGPPKQIEALYALGLNVNWQLGGMGTVDAAKIQSARWQARQAHLEANKELVTILGQVRSSILQSLDSERNVEEASNEVASAAEELRLAQLRFRSGLGTNIDIITAQRDYTQALIDKAQAIINFNIAQAQLLHDTGMISVDTLSSGRMLTR